MPTFTALGFVAFGDGLAGSPPDRERGFGDGLAGSPPDKERRLGGRVVRLGWFAA